MAGSQEWSRFEALGSTAVVAVSDPAGLGDAREIVDQVVAEIDHACSRFRHDSELMAINAAAGEPVRVSPLMLDAVQAAVRAAELTDGDVDPTVGGAVIALGYDRDFSLIGTDRAPRVRATTVPGWRAVQVNPAAGTVRVARGVTLDLGATAKALAADRAAARAADVTGCGVLVSLGGDIAMCGEAPSGGWRIRVTDDHRSDASAPGQSITLSGGGLATSSTTVRRWRVADGVAHHLVDPATGQPAAGPWRTVSVCAATCLDANIASTAAIIRGEAAAPWLESLALPTRLVGVDGVARHLAGWPADGDDLGPGAATRAPGAASRAEVPA